MYKSLIGNIFAAIRKTGIKKSGSAALPPRSVYKPLQYDTFYPVTQKKEGWQKCF